MQQYSTLPPSITDHVQEHMSAHLNTSAHKQTKKKHFSRPILRCSSIYIDKKNMEEHKKVMIKELSLEFSIDLLAYLKKVTATKTLLSTSQLIRAGTAVGANIREAQGAESRKDFIHKMKIAYKEAEETEYWIILFGNDHPMPENEELRNKILRILKMLSKIISTSVANSNKPV
jgi:four helix bundle protein